MHLILCCIYCYYYITGNVFRLKNAVPNKDKMSPNGNFWPSNLPTILYYTNNIISHILHTEPIHLMMLLVTSSLMFLDSWSVSGLSTSCALLQATQLGVSEPQLVNRWLPSYYALRESPLFSQSHFEALSATSVALRMAALVLAPAMPKLLKALERDRAAKPRHPTSIRKHLGLHPAC